MAHSPANGRLGGTQSREEDDNQECEEDDANAASQRPTLQKNRSNVAFDQRVADIAPVTLLTCSASNGLVHRTGPDAVRYLFGYSQGNSPYRLCGNRSMWLDDRAEAALTKAVREIESQSSVEIAIAVRRSARSWPHVLFIAGGVAAWLTLAYMLFADPVYSLWAFLVDPLIAAALAALAASQAPPLARWLTPRRVLRQAVEEAARATFVDRSVHRTRQHSGVLVYCALAERIAVVVPDSGVTSTVAPQALAAWEQSINASLGRGGVATASAIAEMTETFARALPRQDDDVDELPDAILHDIDRRPRS